MRRTGILTVIVLGLLAAPAAAQLRPSPPRPDRAADRPADRPPPPEPQPYRPTTAGASATSCRPARAGSTTRSQLAAFLATGADAPRTAATSSGCTATSSTRRPACRRRRPRQYYKDSSFGVPDGTSSAATRRATTSRSCATRASASRTSTARRATARCSALGYAGAEDRLFFMDVAAPRRPRRSCPASPAARTPRWTASSGRSRRTPRPTSQRQAEPARRRCSARDGAPDPARRRTTTSPASTSTSPRRSSTRRRCPASTPRSGSRRGRTRGSATDLIATASLVGGIFGKGGGDELELVAGRRTRCRSALRRARGAGVFARLPLGGGSRGADDGPRGKRFPYQEPPKQAEAGSVARPDRGLARARSDVRRRAHRRAAARRAAERPARRPADASRSRLQRAAVSGAQVGRAATRCSSPGRRSATSTRRS